MPSQQINQPSNQIKLTNVSFVRMKKGKKRFELACYKNTVTSFRAGVETDLDNVLQISNVFLNVSKGQVAPNEDLKKAFPGMTRDEVVLEILKKGEIQVNEKERSQELERVHKEVIHMVAGQLVDPKSKRVYTTGMIEKALDQLSNQGGHAGRNTAKGQHEAQDRSKSRDQEAAESRLDTPMKNGAANGNAEQAEIPKPKWTGVTTNRSAKAQALEAMKALIAHQPIPVARARMRLRITCPANQLKQNVKIQPKDEGEEATSINIKDKILGFLEQVERQDVIGDEWAAVGLAEPGSFKNFMDFSSTQSKLRARAEILDPAVMWEGD